MGNCDRFEEIQLSTLLAESSPRQQQWARRHAQGCAACQRSAMRDRWLEAAFTVELHEADAGFSGAHRKLMKTLGPRRAFCCRVEGPFGPVYLARTERGLCRVSFRRTEEDFMRELERRELLPEFAPSKMTREARQLEGYFSGRTKHFRIPVDLRLVTPFQKRVLEATASIPFGEVASYTDIARGIGQPDACRAVGGALGKNPVAIVIPCHRVIAADGTIGGYTGGLDIKRELMQIEGIALEKEGS